jgi:hypothetical protein
MVEVFDPVGNIGGVSVKKENKGAIGRSRNQPPVQPHSVLCLKQSLFEGELDPYN